MSLNFQESRVQERMMRIGVEVRQTNATTIDEFYALAVKTLKQSKAKKRAAQTSDLASLFAQQTGELLFFLNHDKCEIIRVHKDDLDQLKSKYSHGELIENSALPRLFK